MLKTCELQCYFKCPNLKRLCKGRNIGWVHGLRNERFIRLKMCVKGESWWSSCHYNQFSFSTFEDFLHITTPLIATAFEFFSTALLGIRLTVSSVWFFSLGIGIAFTRHTAFSCPLVLFWFQFLRRVHASRNYTLNDTRTFKGLHPSFALPRCGGWSPIGFKWNKLQAQGATQWIKCVG